MICGKIGIVKRSLEEVQGFFFIPVLRARERVNYFARARVCGRVCARVKILYILAVRNLATLCNTFGGYPRVTGKRRKLADELASPDFDGNISRLCERHGVARSTLYRWLGETDFKNYVDFLIEKYTDSELTNAWRALVKKANSGNVEALKLFFELKGRYKQQIAIDSGVVIISGENELDE